MTKRALITGITGQDGSYLAELLLCKGYEVHGLIRRSSSFNTGRIEHLYRDPHLEGTRLFLHYGDVTDASMLNRLMRKIRPDEIYNLAAQSHVRVSFDMPDYTTEVVAQGTLRLLEAIREAELDYTRFYQASSSEMFGKVRETPQTEETPFYPRSTYAVAKIYAYWITRHYREAYRIFACNGILFNHESPRRGETFVTRKITKGIAGILAGRQDKIYLGNLEVVRDWGYAPEYVEAMWLMMQCQQPDDFVIATGKSYSVEEFLRLAFDFVGLSYKDYVEIDTRYYRPTETEILRGDASKAKKILGWTPKVGFDRLVFLMLKSDLEEARLDPEEYFSRERRLSYGD